MGRWALDQEWRTDRSAGGMGCDPEHWPRRQDLGWLLNGEAAVIDGTSVRQVFGKRWLEYWASGGHLERPVGLLACGCKWVGSFRWPALPRAVGGKQQPFSGITGIAEARNGDLWLNSWEGVRRVKAAELREAEKNPAYAVHSELYDLTDGLPSVPQRIRPFPTAVSASDGRIWFGLRAGVVSVDPEDPSLSTPAPPVSIVRAIADGKTINAATNTKLAARTKNLEIDYTAVSLNRASRGALSIQVGRRGCRLAGCRFAPASLL